MRRINLRAPNRWRVPVVVVAEFVDLALVGLGERPEDSLWFSVTNRRAGLGLVDQRDQPLASRGRQRPGTGAPVASKLASCASRPMGRAGLP
jgi:hypothetical protein